MKLIPFFIMALIFVSGCATYYPSEISVDNQAPDRVSVDISKNNTKVDITITEQPRQLIKYELKQNTLIDLYCYNIDNERFVINHSILWSYQTNKVVAGNSVYVYPAVEITPLEKLRLNQSSYLTCYLKGFDLSRVEYVDGILISNKTDYIHLPDIFEYGMIELDCADYVNGVYEECHATSNSNELSGFLKYPTSGAYIINKYIGELR